MPESNAAGEPNPPAPPPSNRDADKLRILERHVDHLMGQLYYQIDVIRQYKERAAALDVQVESLKAKLADIEDCPVRLDKALKRVAQLREDLAGRREVEVDLRRRVEELEREESAKDVHIKRIEQMLNRIWQMPHRRLWRGMRNVARRALGLPQPDSSSTTIRKGPDGGR